MTEKHELQEMIENLIARDRNQVDQINDYQGMTIEARIALADGRAQDALGAVMILARYIMEKEQIGIVTKPVSAPSNLEVGVSNESN